MWGFGANGQEGDFGVMEMFEKWIVVRLHNPPNWKNVPSSFRSLMSQGFPSDTLNAT